MFSIRGLFSVTLFVACMAAMAQFGTMRQWHGGYAVLVALVVIQLIAFAAILTWIGSVERVRAAPRRGVALFADVTAMLMFLCQLWMTARLLGVTLL